MRRHRSDRNKRAGSCALKLEESIKDYCAALRLNSRAKAV